MFGTGNASVVRVSLVRTVFAVTLAAALGGEGTVSAQEARRAPSGDGAAAPVPQGDTVAPDAQPSSGRPSSDARVGNAPVKRQRFVALEGHFALASPVGAVGGVLDLGFLPVLSFAVGAGVSPNLASRGSRTSLQLAAMIRARVLSSPGAWQLGLWIAGATGRYAFESANPTRIFEIDRAYWLSPELFLERDLGDGLFLGLHAGPALLLNGEQGRCTVDEGSNVVYQARSQSCPNAAILGEGALLHLGVYLAGSWDLGK